MESIKPAGLRGRLTGCIDPLVMPSCRICSFNHYTTKEHQDATSPAQVSNGHARKGGEVYLETGLREGDGRILESELLKDRYLRDILSYGVAGCCGVV